MSGPIGLAPKEYDQHDMQRILSTIEQRLVDVERAKSAGWAVTNFTAYTKTLDITGATAAQVRSALGSLIKVLRDSGVLSGS